MSYLDTEKAMKEKAIREKIAKEKIAKEKITRARAAKAERISITEGSLKWWDYLIFGIVGLICFFCFQQRDLMHTAGCSVGFLNGHFRDFYDYCGLNNIHPSYMPTVYVLFAIWNIPMKLFGFLTVPTEEISLTATMWSKLLPCIVYVLSWLIIYRICILTGMGSKKSKYCAYACLTMPVAFYDQFIFGQYDIFMTACALLGVYYYLKKKDFCFVFWFAVAVTFKYTAIVIFLPLLLLRQKNVWRVVGNCILLMVPFALEYLIFRNSAGFKSYTFGIGSSGDNPTGYIFSAGIYTGYQLSAIKYQVSLVVMVYGLILGYAYFTKPKEGQETAKWVFYLACLSFFALFGLSKWHPQWLLFAVPFWVISAFMHKDTKIFMILDLLFMVFFVIFIVETIPNNVDQAMINKGVLGRLVNYNIGTKVMMKDLVGRLDPELCLSLLSMMMLVYGVFKHPKYCLSDISEDISCMGWIRTRFLAGVGFFVLPAFVCLAAALCAPYAGYQVSAGETPVVSLTGTGDFVSQRFCATGDQLNKLQFPVMVNGQINNGCLKITLIDCQENAILYEEDWETAGFVDYEIINADFGGIPTAEGQYYEVLFEITRASGEFRLSLLGEEADLETVGTEFAEKDGNKQNYRIAMTVYQQ